MSYQQNGLPLGKPIRPPVVEKPDEWEHKVSHGYNVWKNKRTGHIQTNNHFPPPPPPPIPLPEVVITTEQWDAIIGARQAQEDDGFSFHFYGAM